MKTKILFCLLLVLALCETASAGSVYNLFCTDKQVNNVIDNMSAPELLGQSSEVFGFYSKDSVRYLENGNIAVDTTFLYNRTGNANLVHFLLKNGKKIGYLKIVKEFNPNNMMTRIFGGSFYCCAGTPIFPMSTQNWMAVIEGSLDEELLGKLVEHAEQ